MTCAYFLAVQAPAWARVPGILSTPDPGCDASEVIGFAANKSTRDAHEHLAQVAEAAEMRHGFGYL